MAAWILHDAHRLPSPGPCPLEAGYRRATRPITRADEDEQGTGRRGARQRVSDLARPDGERPAVGLGVLGQEPDRDRGALRVSDEQWAGVVEGRLAAGELED